MATTQPVTDWKKEWVDIADAAYLNTANHAAMPRVSLRAVQASLEAKKFPHHVDDSAFFEVPIRLRASIARLIGSKPEEIALTTGADLVLKHNRKLIEFLFECLPDDCVPASPLDCAQRGQCGCFTAPTPEKTAELYKRLRQENVVVSMREGRIRVSPHLFNSEQDIDRLIGVVSERSGHDDK
jgi:selenocysteine lyase/cysteine desulfurase